MPFRVKPDGSVETDTVEEFEKALRAVRSVNGHHLPVKPEPREKPPRQRPRRRSRTRATRTAPSSSSPEQGKIGRFFESLQDPQQRKLLNLLAHSTQGLSDAEMRQGLNLSSNVALRGLLIGLSRHASTAGLGEIVHREMTRTAGGKKRLYHYTMKADVAAGFKRVAAG